MLLKTVSTTTSWPRYEVYDAYEVYEINEVPGVTTKSVYTLRVPGNMAPAGPVIIVITIAHHRR